MNVKVGEGFASTSSDAVTLLVRVRALMLPPPAPTVGVQFVTLTRQGDSFGRVQASSNKHHECVDVAVFGVSGRMVVLWGYMTASSLSALPSVFLNRSKCSVSLTSSPLPPVVVVETAPCPHSSFVSYSNGPPQVGDDLSVVHLQEAVGCRFLLYEGTPCADVKVDRICTELSVCVDEVVYFLVIAALQDPAFRYKYQDVSPEKLFAAWLERETALTRRRLDSMPVAVVAAQLLGCNMVPLMDYEQPFMFCEDEDYITIPFELLAPRLLAQRRVRIRRGAAIVGTRYIKEAALSVLVAAHRRNWTHNTRSVKRIVSVSSLVAFVQKRFALLCGHHPRYIHMSVPLSSVAPKQSLVSASALMQLAPRCMQAMHSSAVDIEDLSHNKFNARSAFARYLMELGWTSEDVYRTWEAKLDRVYSSRRQEIKAIKSKLKDTENKMNQSPTMGPTCKSLPVYGLCPYASNRQCCTDDFVQRFQKMRPGVALPAACFRTPSQFTKHLIAELKPAGMQKQ